MKKILWFDDNNFAAFIDEAYDENIDITRAATLRDGLQYLKQNDLYYDLMLFDACYCKRDNQSSSMILKDTIEQCRQAAGNDTPWLVFSAGTGFDGADKLDAVIPEMPWHTDLKLPLWYSKHKAEDIARILTDIHRVVDYIHSPYRKIKEKYAQVFQLFHPDFGAYLPEDSESDLVDILSVLEDPNKYTDTKYFNAIRCFMEGPVLLALKDYNIIHINATLNDLKHKFKDWKWEDKGVYSWVRNALFYVISATQDASHDSKVINSNSRSPQIKDSVQSGIAPFLLPSVIHSLLCILTWLQEFLDRHPDAEVNEFVFLDE